MSRDWVSKGKALTSSVVRKDDRISTRQVTVPASGSTSM